jgi:hypothetical protein
MVIAGAKFVLKLRKAAVSYAREVKNPVSRSIFLETGDDFGQKPG